MIEIIFLSLYLYVVINLVITTYIKNKLVKKDKLYELDHSKHIFVHLFFSWFFINKIDKIHDKFLYDFYKDEYYYYKSIDDINNIRKYAKLLNMKERELKLKKLNNKFLNININF